MRASRTRRRIARTLNVLIVAGLAVAFGPPPAPPAEAAAKQTLFRFGSDQFNSFWRNQQEVQVAVPDQACEAVPDAPCLSTPVKLSNPDGADALPVAVSPERQQDGSLVATAEKMSAISINLEARDVPFGADVTLFTISLLEEGTRNADGKIIKACRITDLWAHDETGAELWSRRPTYSDGCVAGKRNAGATETRWTFTLTTFAKPWGIDPTENNGVMFVPEIPANAGSTENWQVTLKVPQPDNVNTEDANEYEETKNRVRVVYDFRPPPPEPPIDDGGDDGGGGGGPVGPVPPVDPGPIGPVDPVPTPTTSPEPPADPEPIADKKPGPPAQVWLLVPFGLLALAMTRSAIDEPVGESGAGRGVVAAIRRRNAASRGASGERPVTGTFFKKIFGRFRR